MTKKQQFNNRIKEYRLDPVLFFREVLLFEPDSWQKGAAKDVSESPKVSIRSGQGVGKTAFQAAIALTLASLRRRRPDSSLTMSCGLRLPSGWKKARFWEVS